MPATDADASLHGAHVLVTGARGLIGRATTAELERLGAMVRPLDLAAGQDVTDPAVVAAALEGIDGVVHLAAIPHPRNGTPFEVFTNNVAATFAVLATAAELGIPRAVCASSINASGVPFNHHAVTWDRFPIDPSQGPYLDDPYSLSKATGEDVARMCASRWGLATTSLRLPYTATAAAVRDHAEEYRRDPASGVREGWSYLDVRDAARAVVCGLLARVPGAAVYSVAAPLTLAPYRTEALLDRYAPGVRRDRVFPGREVPMDLEPVRRDLGFEPRHVLDLPALELPDRP